MAAEEDKWNVDSTGGRHLVYVWYKPADSDDYRCLNLELIQNGLSIACGTTADRYGEAASAAFQQAKNQKFHVFSGENDPDFFYGDAYELDIKGLRTNIALYDNLKVAFEGVVTRNNNNSVYVESYDAETDMYNPTGCWNPTFKASYNDIECKVQVAMKHIIKMLSKLEPLNSFYITEDDLNLKINKL